MKTSIIFGGVALLAFTAFAFSIQKPEIEIIEQKTIRYSFCKDDKNIRYYDRDVDLVFEDYGIKGCEQIELKPSKKVNGVIRESGKFGDIVWGSDYGDRQFNRHDYDTGRFLIVE